VVSVTNLLNIVLTNMSVYSARKINGTQVSVEPCPSALNMMLPAFGWAIVSYRSISAADARAQQQTRRPPMLLSIDRTDGHPTVP